MDRKENIWVSIAVDRCLKFKAPEIHTPPLPSRLFNEVRSNHTWLVQR